MPTGPAGKRVGDGHCGARRGSSAHPLAPKAGVALLPEGQAPGRCPEAFPAWQWSQFKGTQVVFKMPSAEDTSPLRLPSRAGSEADGQHRTSALTPRRG